VSLQDSVKTWKEQSLRFLAELASRVESIPALAANPETIHSATELISGLQTSVDDTVRHGAQWSRTYANAYAAFAPVLSAKVSSASAVREFDGLITAINGWSHVRVLTEYNRLLNESLEFVRKVEAHLQSKQDEMLQSRGLEINEWYDMMNPEAAVRYRRMETATDNVLLWAETFGVEMNAAACLSQCQLNCLGLSIHFVRALTPGTPYGFLLLDDPVQSMDDDHCQALIVKVIDSLLSRRHQLLVFSHVQGLVDTIWYTYYHHQPLRLRISDYQLTGPVVEEAETLQHAVNRAAQLARGNEDNRRLAIKVVRRCVELLIREVCRRKNSTPPPFNATASQMLPYFQNCQGTTAQQHQGLQATVKFADPASHTQTGWEVPIATNIQPHIDRLRTSAQQLGVL